MSTVPNAFRKNYLESNPSYRPGQNEEADALLNPSISAKPLHVPMAGQIAKRLNTEVEFFWAFDRNGQSPFHTRVEQLRAVGFEYATTKDAEMAVADTVQSETEIRNGDRRLMKVSKRRWLEIRKSQQLASILAMNPKGKVQGEDGTVMGTANLIPGIKTTVQDEAPPDVLARSVAEQIDEKTGTHLHATGNTSVIAKDKVNKLRS